MDENKGMIGECIHRFIESEFKNDKKYFEDWPKDKSSKIHDQKKEMTWLFDKLQTKLESLCLHYQELTHNFFHKFEAETTLKGRNGTKLRVDICSKDVVIEIKTQCLEKDNIISGVSHFLEAETSENETVWKSITEDVDPCRLYLNRCLNVEIARLDAIALWQLFEYAEMLNATTINTDIKYLFSFLVFYNIENKYVDLFSVRRLYYKPYIKEFLTSCFCEFNNYEVLKKWYLEEINQPTIKDAFDVLSLEDKMKLSEVYKKMHGKASVKECINVLGVLSASI